MSRLLCIFLLLSTIIFPAYSLDYQNSKSQIIDNVLGNPGEAYLYLEFPYSKDSWCELNISSFDEIFFCSFDDIGLIDECGDLAMEMTRSSNHTGRITKNISYEDLNRLVGKISKDAKCFEKNQ